MAGIKEYYDSPEIDIDILVRNAIESGFNPTVFNKIDDSDFEAAPNFMEFCISNKHLGQNPWPWQMMVATTLLEEFCPYCTNPKWMVKDPTFGYMSLTGMHRQSIPEMLENICFLDYGVCPKCGMHRGDFIKEGLFTYPDALAVAAGQRIGKSLGVVVPLSLYQVQRFLKLGDPIQYYNLTKAAGIYWTFTALTYDKAVELLYEPFTNLYKESPWFSQYEDAMDYYAKKFDLPPIIECKPTFTTFSHRRLAVIPEGPDKRKLRGKTRLGYAVDEIGWMNAKSKDTITVDPDEIEQALSRSLLTLRDAGRVKVNQGEYNCPNAYSILVSSPSHANDKIMRTVRSATETPSARAFHLSTWNAHPTITRESLKNEFQANSINADRDYGANPPMSDSPFFDNTEAVLKVFTGVAFEKFGKVTRKTHGNTDFKYCYLEYAPVFGDKSNPYLLSLDAGLSDNSFALSLAHYDNNKKVTDMLIECKPESGEKVNFTLLYTHCIKPILSTFKVPIVTADRWNSVKLLQDIEQDYPGTKVIQYSVNYVDHLNYKKWLYEERNLLPALDGKPEEITSPKFSYNIVCAGRPILHMLLQLLTVKGLGRSVEKGDGLTDDLYRADVLNFAVLTNEDHKKLLWYRNGSKGSSRGGGLGAKKGRGVGGISSSGGSTSQVARIGSIRKRGFN